MPIYDYVCSNCLTRTEFIHGIDAPQPRFCPSCGAEDTLRKAFVAPSVHFKGSGWAKKDRGASSATKAAARASGGANADRNASGSANEGDAATAGPSTAGDGSPSGASASDPSTAASSPKADQA